MSIIEIHRYRNSTATELLPRHSHDAISEYKRALTEARIASLKLVAVRSGASAPPSFPARRALAVFRRMFARWSAKRQDERRRRELEEILRSLDAHTLADIGFEGRPCAIGHWHLALRAVPTLDHLPS